MTPTGGQEPPDQSPDPGPERPTSWRDTVHPAEPIPVSDAMVSPKSDGESDPPDGPSCHICGVTSHAAASYCLNCGVQLHSASDPDADHNADPDGDDPNHTTSQPESVASDGFIDPDDFVARQARHSSQERPGSGPNTESIDVEREERDTQRTLRVALGALMVVAALTLFVVTFGDRGDPPVDDGPSTTLTAIDAETRYRDLVSSLAVRVDQLRDEAGVANDQWDNGTADYADTLSRLQSLAASSLPLQATVDESEAPSAADLTLKARLVALAATLAESANEMVAGLESPDTGEARRAAMTRYDAAAAEFSTVAETILQNMANSDE